MSATEDESQQLDAGWGDDAPSEAEVDEAWDSVAPGVSSATSAVAPVSQAEAAEVDGGWDDVPEPSGAAQAPSGKRRPHRERRAKSSVIAPSASPVLRARPAENNKKQQREHARKLRALEAQTKQQRKLERKAERAAEARAEAEARVLQAEAAERARRAREEARDRARSERPAAKPENVTKPAKAKAKPRAAEAKRSAAPARSVVPAKPRLSPGMIIIVLALIAVAAFFLLRK